MGDVIVPGELDQPANAFNWLYIEERQSVFGRADSRICRLENREKHSVFVAEIVVKHPLVGLGARGDPIDACAAQSVAGEFARRGREDDGLRAGGVARVARTPRQSGKRKCGYAHGSMLTSWLINRKERRDVIARSTSPDPAWSANLIRGAQSIKREDHTMNVFRRAGALLLAPIVAAALIAAFPVSALAQ